jgi:hypothetical protein
MMRAELAHQAKKAIDTKGQLNPDVVRRIPDYGVWARPQREGDAGSGSDYPGKEPREARREQHRPATPSTSADPKPEQSEVHP